MCERRDASRRPDDRRDLANRRAAAGTNPGRPSPSSTSNASRRFGHVTGRDERIGQLRAANRPARSCARRRRRADQSRPHTRDLQTSRHHVQATQTVGALRAQEIDERSKLRIDEVAQDVDVARRLDGGDFDPRNKTKTVPVGSGLRFGMPEVVS